LEKEGRISPAAPGNDAAGAETAIDERRRHRRFFEEVRVRYRDLEGTDPSAWGRSRNLSLGGICLIAEQRVPIGCHLALEINIENETAPLLALGRVVRCDADDHGCAAGIEFLWISEEDRSNLRRLAEFFRKKYGDSGELNGA